MKKILYLFTLLFLSSIARAHLFYGGFGLTSTNVPAARNPDTLSGRELHGGYDFNLGLTPIPSITPILGGLRFEGGIVRLSETIGNDLYYGAKLDFLRALPIVNPYIGFLMFNNITDGNQSFPLIDDNKTALVLGIKANLVVIDGFAFIEDRIAESQNGINYNHIVGGFSIEF